MSDTPSPHDPHGPPLMPPAPAPAPASAVPPPPVGPPGPAYGNAGPVLATAPARAKPSGLSRVLMVLGIVFVGLLILGAIGATIAAIAGSGGDDDPSIASDFIVGDKSSTNRILAIPITGVILGEDTGGGGGGLFGGLSGATYGYTIAEQLADAAEDDSIDAVVLEMDTPGGTIFGSHVINEAVIDYRKTTGKPVLAHVRGISASGGMYSMASADRILADHGTLIGSIGVIFGPFLEYTDVVALDQGILFGGVETTGGITAEPITAGRGKDVGSPWRPMSDEERATLQQGVDNAYDEFVTVVAEGRGLDPASIVDDLGAMIFDEKTAVDNGLIDGIADRDDAYAAAAKLAGLSDDDWKAERISKPSAGLFSLFASAPSDTGSGSIAVPAGVCSGSVAVLVYHGDPRTFCALVAAHNAQADR